MTLAELAFASFIFRKLDSGAYERLLKYTNGHLDLTNTNHRLRLLKWLNDWGCRHISKNHHKDASRQIRLWYEKYKNRLFNDNISLQDLNEENLNLAGSALDDLSKAVVACRILRGGANSCEVKLGAVAAAKLLFALKPKALMAWDKSIMGQLGYDGSGDSYVGFLRYVQALLGEIEQLCNQYGFTLAELPNRLNRPQATLPKLVDEYFWITITKECKPSQDDFQRWSNWTG